MAEDQRRDIDLGITRFEYGEHDRPQRAVLEIRTGKHYHGGLASNVQVFWVGNHSRQCLMGIGGGGDFSKLVEFDKTIKVATQKAIDRFHAKVFTPEAIAKWAAAAKAHYADVIAAGIDGFGNTYVPAGLEVIRTTEPTITPISGGFVITRTPCVVCGEPPFGDEYCCGHEQKGDAANA